MALGGSISLCVVFPFLPHRKNIERENLCCCCGPNTVTDSERY